MNPLAPKAASKSSFRRRGLILYFCLVFLAMIWPVYPLFSRAFPLIFGMPFSLFYIVVLLVVSFLVLLFFYLTDEDPEGEP